ncbi:MAG: hypothetical protein K0U52_07595 [Gammaproteobacteria bacterium]|nr:hypothetical protein [Gammaproteobacteria bacterium]
MPHNDVKRIVNGPHYKQLVAHAASAMPVYYYTCPSKNKLTGGVVIKDSQELPSTESMKELVTQMEAMSTIIENMLPGFTSGDVQEARDIQEYVQDQTKQHHIDQVNEEYKSQLDQFAPSVAFEDVATCASVNEVDDNAEIISGCEAQSQCQAMENDGANACVPKDLVKIATHPSQPSHSSQSVAQWWQNYRRARVE